MNDIEYVREGDRQEYLRFAAHHLRSFGHPPVSEIWHYTDAEGLVGILKSGQLWCTQVSCLNDSLEQRYFGDLMHAAVKARRAKNTDTNLAILLRIAEEFLGGRDFSADAMPSRKFHVARGPLQTATETGLRGWAYRTRTQKCRRKLSL
jgi:hypothetical protein